MAGFKPHRLLKTIGWIPPAEAEAIQCRQPVNQVTKVVAGLDPTDLNKNWGGSVLERRCHIDLLVIDVRQPGMNSRQRAAITGQRDPRLRALLVTGYAERATACNSLLGAGRHRLAQAFALDVADGLGRAIIDGAPGAGPGRQ